MGKIKNTSLFILFILGYSCNTLDGDDSDTTQGPPIVQSQKRSSSALDHESPAAKRAYSNDETNICMNYGEFILFKQRHNDILTLLEKLKIFLENLQCQGIIDQSSIVKALKDFKELHNIALDYICCDINQKVNFDKIEKNTETDATLVEEIEEIEDNRVNYSNILEYIRRYKDIKGIKAVNQEIKKSDSFCSWSDIPINRLLLLLIEFYSTLDSLAEEGKSICDSSLVGEVNQLKQYYDYYYRDIYNLFLANFSSSIFSHGESTTTIDFPAPVAASVQSEQKKDSLQELFDFSPYERTNLHHTPSTSSLGYEYLGSNLNAPPFLFCNTQFLFADINNRKPTITQSNGYTTDQEWQPLSHDIPPSNPNSFNTIPPNHKTSTTTIDSPVAPPKEKDTPAEERFLKCYQELLQKNIKDIIALNKKEILAYFKTISLSLSLKDKGMDTCPKCRKSNIEKSNPMYIRVENTLELIGRTLICNNCRTQNVAYKFILLKTSKDQLLVKPPCQRHIKTRKNLNFEAWSLEQKCSVERNKFNYFPHHNGLQVAYVTLKCSVLEHSGLIGYLSHAQESFKVDLNGVPHSKKREDLLNSCKKSTLITIEQFPYLDNGSKELLATE